MTFTFYYIIHSTYNLVWLFWWKIIIPYKNSELRILFSTSFFISSSHPTNTAIMTRPTSTHVTCICHVTYRNTKTTWSMRGILPIETFAVGGDGKSSHVDLRVQMTTNLGCRWKRRFVCCRICWQQRSILAIIIYIIIYILSFLVAILWDLNMFHVRIINI